MSNQKNKVNLGLELYFLTDTINTGTISLHQTSVN